MGAMNRLSESQAHASQVVESAQSAVKLSSTGKARKAPNRHGELSQKIAWAIGNTLGTKYSGRGSSVYQWSSELAGFILAAEADGTLDDVLSTGSLPENLRKTIRGPVQVSYMAPLIQGVASH